MSRQVLSGYTDRPSYRPGEAVMFHLASPRPTSVDASIVRLIHGDPSPHGPGFKQEKVADVPGPIRLEAQTTQAGSHVSVGEVDWSEHDRLTVHTFVWPTVVREQEPQTLLSCWDPHTNQGWSLELIEGRLAARIGTEDEHLLVSSGSLFSHTWYSVSMVLDWSAGTVSLEQRLISGSANGRYSPIVDLEPHHAWTGHFAGVRGHGATRVHLGARAAVRSGIVNGTTAHLNGKLDSPAVYASMATRDDFDLLADGAMPPSLAPLASWDFSSGITHLGFTDDSHVADASGNDHHGTTVNFPDRAMTGRNWSGREEHFVHAPEEYGAIWFHADAVEDCGWDPSLLWTVPDDLASGCYALWLRGAGGAEDHIPFFVTPSDDRRQKIAVLIPTFSYVAYANTVAMQTGGGAQLVMGIVATLDDVDLHIAENLRNYGLSTYTYTKDGKGTQFSSWRRPIMDMRPRHRHEYGSYWQFPADLYLIDWLTHSGFAFDVITDHDLHEHGAELLEHYNVVLTGTHPEYVSERMLNAWETYLGNGGRGMYMGGNGFYWVTTPHPRKPWLIEMRRGEVGDQGWRAEAGEKHHQITGERGGLWRMRGRPPQKLWGVGYGAHGLDRSAPYLQMPHAQDPRWQWILEGVAANEAIGDFGLSNGGAAGLEFDHMDYTLGTPPHAALLGSSFGHSRNAAIAVEDVFLARDGMNGIESPLVRADLTFFTTRHGGAVFATGSMTWCGSLSHNDYDNNVATITRNILQAFAADGPVAAID